MGILSRMFRLCKADVHGVMDQLEDKGLLLKQHLREMENNLKEKEAQLKKLEYSYRQAERDLAVRKEQVEKLEMDLDLAVRKEKDDIARMLIRKRRVYQGNWEQLIHQIEKLKEERDRLAETLDKHRMQYEQLKVKAASFYSRAQQQEFESVINTETCKHWKTPTEEEIELELLQRKEAVQQGGAS